MKKHRAFTSLMALLVTGLGLGASALADEEQDFHTWMKTTGATVGKLRKEIDAKSFPDAASDATTLQDVFQHVEDYWTKAGSADAIKLSQQAKLAAGDIVTAAGSSNAENAAAALKSLTSTCSGCHGAHRERKEDGAFVIKP